MIIVILLAYLIVGFFIAKPIMVWLKAPMDVKNFVFFWLTWIVVPFAFLAMHTAHAIVKYPTQAINWWLSR